MKKDSVKKPSTLVKSYHDVLKPAWDFCKLIEKSDLPISGISVQAITKVAGGSWGSRISISRETPEGNIKVNVSLWSTRQSLILILDNSKQIDKSEIWRELESLKEQIVTGKKSRKK